MVKIRVNQVKLGLNLALKELYLILQLNSECYKNMLHNFLVAIIVKVMYKTTIYILIHEYITCFIKIVYLTNV